MGRLIAIGDIHGHAETLLRLLDRIEPTPEDTIVTLGDYVNRGPDSKGVINALIDLRQACNLVSILGNHDELMLSARDADWANDAFLYQGGSETLASYHPDASLEHVPQEHWEFLAGCVPLYEHGDYVFTHANYCWYTPLTEQPAQLLRWTSVDESPPKPHLNGKTFIVGHTPGEVRNNGHWLCIDTGCGLGGKLTAWDMDERKSWER